MINKQPRDIYEYVANEELRVHVVDALIKSKKQVKDFHCAGSFLDFMLDYIDDESITLGVAVELPETIETIYYKVTNK